MIEPGSLVVLAYDQAMTYTMGAPSNLRPSTLIRPDAGPFLVLGTDEDAALVACAGQVQAVAWIFISNLAEIAAP